MFDDLRTAWGARKPKNALTYADPYHRTEFFVHYDGGSAVNVADHAGCLARVKQDQAFHMDGRGWSDVGYNGLVCQHGRAIEGRGLDYVGAHCPDHNTSGYGFQFMVGGSQQPTDAAKARMRRLYDDACTHSKRTLAKRGHRDGFATECPGDQIYAWVKSGMPSPTAPAPAAPKEWFDMPVPDADIAKIAQATAAAILNADVIPQPHPTKDNPNFTVASSLEWTGKSAAVTQATVTTLVTAVQALATAKGADADAITKAVVDKIAALDLSISVKE